MPRSLIDAARLDGMGELRIVFTVFWPLAGPPLAMVGLFVFMGSWNEVLWPLLVIREEGLMTLPQLLTVFKMGGAAGPGGLAVQLAAGMVLVVPVVVENRGGEAAGGVRIEVGFVHGCTIRRSQRAVIVQQALLVK